MKSKPDGTTISHEYDAKSRLTRQTNSSTNEMVNFSYDAKGQLVSAQNAATSLTRSYDSAGRVLGETSRVSSDIASLSDAKTISYSYNPDGLVAQMARPIGYGDSYQYDARNQLSTITSNAFGAPVVSYQRNPRGQITATTQRNGITNVRNYDDAAQLLSTDYFDGQNLISRAAYTYSQAGQRSSLTRENAQSEQFGYDNARQLTSVTRGTSASQNDSYSYDLNGNRASASDQNIASPHSYSVNNLNQYTAISGKNLSYDANGNQTTSPQDAGASLKYDWNDRLIQVNATSATKAQPATSGLAWDEIRYVYDPLGRRLAKTVTENGAFKRATRFIYDGWNVVEERTERQGAPGISKFLFWGEDLSGSMQGAGGVGGLLTQMEKTDTTNWSASYYHYDGNGNVATVSGPFRAVIAKFSYDGFGRSVTQTGAKSGIDINAIPYRFSTKPMELELATANTTLVPPPVSSGLYYYGYRFYSPNLGRWISRDPIREKGGRNLYNFVGNDGVDKIDKFGLLFNLNFDYTQNLQIGGCFYLPVAPLVSICLTGGYTVTLSKCCKDNKKKNLTTISGDINLYVAIQAIAPLSFSYTKGVNVASNGVDPPCPKEDGDWNGSAFVGVNLGFFNAQFTYDDGQWTKTVSSQLSNIAGKVVYGGGAFSIRKFIVK